MTDPLPVDSPAFWRGRLADADAEFEPHKAVWNIDRPTWDAVNESHRRLLAELIRPGAGRVDVLDCGCGLGTLVELLPPGGVRYAGVDICAEFVERAKRDYPEHAATIQVADLRALPFDDATFDVAVVRSVEGMVTANLGTSAWRAMEAEILRVADRLVVMSYERPTVAHVMDSPTAAKRELWRVRSIVHPHGRLDYRLGQDATAEIFDLFIDESHRGEGVGRELIGRLQSEGFRSVYAFTRATNAGARAFYARLGFAEAVVPGFYRGMDGVFLSLVGDAGIAPSNPLL